MKKKLFIISYYFPPVNTIASKRWYEMIPTLSNFYDIYVFTPRIRTNFENDFIERYCKLYTSGENVISTKSGLLSKIIDIALRIINLKFRTVDSSLFFWYKKNISYLNKVVKEVKPDYLITSVGPFSSAIMGYKIKKSTPSVQWIVDLRDSVSLFNKKSKIKLFQFLDEYFDKRIIKQADYILTVSKTLAEIQEEFYEKRNIIIYNGYDVDDSLTSNIDRRENSKILMYYAGSMYGHREQSFYLLIDTIKGMEDVHLKIRLLGKDRWKNKYISYIKLNNVRNVEILNSANNEIIKNEELASNVLVLFEDLDCKNEISKGNLTGKLFEYMPFVNSVIIAICRKDSDINEILSSTNRGAVLSTKEDIIRFLNDYKCTEKFRCKDIELYSREYQAIKLYECLESIN